MRLKFLNAGGILYNCSRNAATIFYISYFLIAKQ